MRGMPSDKFDQSQVRLAGLHRGEPKRSWDGAASVQHLPFGQ